MTGVCTEGNIRQCGETRVEHPTAGVTAEDYIHQCSDALVVQSAYQSAGLTLELLLKMTLVKHAGASIVDPTAVSVHVDAIDNGQARDANVVCRKYDKNLAIVVTIYRQVSWPRTIDGQILTDINPS